MGSSRNFGCESNIFRLLTEVDTQQWRAEGGAGANGAPDPGIQVQGVIQRAKLQKLKCCNWMIFPIVSLLIHAVWI